MANACCFAHCQGPIQAFLRPGIWLPGVRNLHMTKDTWEISASPQEALDAVVRAVTTIAEDENLQIRKEDREGLFLEIWSYTAHCNWLDIVDVRFREGKDSSVTITEARSFSSGVFPACCPLGFILNCIFFWVPFSGNGFNDHRLEAIRNAITGTEVKLIDHGPTCC